MSFWGKSVRDYKMEIAFQMKETYLRVLFKDFGKIHVQALFKGNIALYKAIEDSILNDSKFHGQNPIIMPLQFYELEKGSWN